MKKLLILALLFSALSAVAQPVYILQAGYRDFFNKIKADSLCISCASGDWTDYIFQINSPTIALAFEEDNDMLWNGLFYKPPVSYSGTSNLYMKLDPTTSQMSWGRPKKTDIDDMDATEVGFGHWGGNGGIQTSDSMTYNSSSTLALNGRFNITGLGNTSATKSLYIESSTAELRMEVYDSDLIRLRPATNIRYDFGNTKLAFLTDGGIIRSQTIQGGTITWDYVRHNTTNSTLTPSSTAGNFYFWNTSNSTDVGASQGTNDLIVWKTEPTWNLTNVLSTGKVIGYYYNPTVTSLAASNPHYFLYATSGLTKLGDVTQDDALTKIMALDASNRIYWRDVSTIGGGGAGTVTSFSATDDVVFDWTVANATTTPALSGILKDRDAGDITLTASGVTWTIDNGAVSNAKLANSTISGISLGSNLADLTATNTTLTFSGTYNGSTARTIGLNLGNANTWTVDQSVPDEAYGSGWNGSVEVPTKNAVYDKINAMTVDFGTVTDVSHTGNTSETKSYSISLPANTLRTGDIIEIVWRYRKTGTAGALVPRIRFGTTDDLAGTLSATSNMGSTALYGQFSRWFIIKSSTSMEVFNSTQNNVDDVVQNTSAVTNITIDLTVQNYIVFSLQLANSGDTGIFSFASAEVKRY